MQHTVLSNSWGLVTVYLCTLTMALVLPMKAQAVTLDARGNEVSPVDDKSTTSDAPAEQSVTRAETARSEPTVAEAAPGPGIIKPETKATEISQKNLAEKKKPSTKEKISNAKIFYEMDRQNLAPESANSADYLKTAQESAEDEYARKARLLTLAKQARKGDLSAEAEIESFPEEEKSNARLALAEAWDTCYRNDQTKTKCLETAERNYRFLMKADLESDAGKQAALKLAALCDKTMRYDLMISALVPAMKILAADARYADRAWYFLGTAWENSTAHKDPYKAFLAYKKVTDNSESRYKESAERKMADLKYFYLGN